MVEDEQNVTISSNLYAYLLIAKWSVMDFEKVSPFIIRLCFFILLCFFLLWFKDSALFLKIIKIGIKLGMFLQFSILNEHIKNIFSM